MEKCYQEVKACSKWKSLLQIEITAGELIAVSPSIAYKTKKA